ncbi:uncharacterized protein TM35_001131030 [Trypanosoma theileri]|uniref:Uncharacterized protein n=1 Tax=Trypanosoma theileri TaxID=67003 RepID=A0A1X0NE54_9TRYP|nr:uncharacterized protein TM35_001131030 [Trypanosoma theileri]ORC81577.1 hypothetical protein TM35_001131030 [Trypanosoma theileri]
MTTLATSKVELQLSRQESSSQTNLSGDFPLGGNMLPRSISKGNEMDVEMQQRRQVSHVQSTGNNDRDGENEYVSWSGWFGQNVWIALQNLYAGWNAAFSLAWEHRLYDRDLDFFGDQISTNSVKSNLHERKRSSEKEPFEEV